MTKICSKCKIEKSLDNFFNLAKAKDGKKGACKQCEKEWYLKNKIRIVERISERYRQDSEFKEIVLQRSRKHALDNRKRYNVMSSIRSIQLRKEHVQYRIKHNLTSQLGLALKKQNASKKSRIIKLLACSIEEFKLYIEGKFKEGMSWSNYGKWQLDHIRPTSSFNLNELKDQQECFHYSNFQPLWCIDNVKKGSYYEGRKHTHKNKN